jgi:hypothetical protein
MDDPAQAAELALSLLDHSAERAWVGHVSLKGEDAPARSLDRSHPSDPIPYLVVYD